MLADVCIFLLSNCMGYFEFMRNNPHVSDVSSFLQTCFSLSTTRTWSLEDSLTPLLFLGVLPPKRWTACPKPFPLLLLLLPLPSLPPPPRPPSLAVTPTWMPCWARLSPVAPQPQTRPSSLPPSSSLLWLRSPALHRGSNHRQANSLRASGSPLWNSPSRPSVRRPPRRQHPLTVRPLQTRLSAPRRRRSSHPRHLRLHLSPRHNLRPRVTLRAKVASRVSPL